MFREYRYRKLFNATHDQFLDEPRDLVTWFLKFDEVVGEVVNGE